MVSFLNERRNKIENIGSTAFVLTIMILFVLSVSRATNAVSIFQADNYFQLAGAKDFLENGFPTKDPLSMHHEFDYMMPQWLFALILYVIKVTFGNNACLNFFILLGFVFVALAYRVALLVNQNKNAAFVSALIISFPIFLMFYRIRPWCFSIILCLCEIYVLEKYIKTKDKRLFLLIGIISCSFVNLHNSLWISLFLIQLSYIGDSVVNLIFHKSNEISLRDILLITAISILCGFINPYGVKYTFYIFPSMSVIDRIYVGECRPNIFLDKYEYVFLIFILIASVVKFKKDGIKFRYLFLSLGSAVLELSSFRNGILFYTFSIPLFAWFLKDCKFVVVSKRAYVFKTFFISIILIAFFELRIQDAGSV